MREGRATMAILAKRTRCPRELKSAVARNLCLLLLVWVCCSGGHELSLKAVAEQNVRNSPGSRAENHDYDSSGVPEFGIFGPSQAAAAWQLPKGSIRKVLIIFESLNVQPYEFWDRSPSCRRCTGLPEKRKIVIDAIARNYAVFIPRSLDLEGVWDTTDEKMGEELTQHSPDVLNSLYILAEWKSTIGLHDDVPTVALGVSTGGKILSTLSLFPGIFESIAMMISEGVVNAFESATSDYPPTIFIHMPKDTDTAEMVSYERKLLSSTGVATKEVKWYEHKVTPDWFAEIIPGVDQALSREMHRHLRELGWLEDKTGFLKSDIDFQTDWVENVREWNLLPPGLDETEELLFDDMVFEELSVAYANHVTLSRNNNDLFAWFEGGYKGPEIGGYAQASLFREASYTKTTS